MSRWNKCVIGLMFKRGGTDLDFSISGVSGDLLKFCLWESCGSGGCASTV